MATYKVIQDIEAEDKFVGPLTLKQFIFAAIFVVCGYMSFLFLTKHVWFLMIPLLPVMFATGFLAFPWGRDQPTETWLLAKVSFLLKPHRRIWDQSGVEELVTITAPKKAEAEYLSNNLSQTEVKSRLHALADTIDTRGWATKNVDVNLFAQPGYGASPAPTDRLVAASTLPVHAIVTDVHAADDMLDETNNATAQKLDQLVVASEENRRKQMLKTVDDARDRAKQADEAQKQPHKGKKPQHYWFMDEPAKPPIKAPTGYATFTAQTLDPGAMASSSTKSTALSAEEKALLEKVHKEKAKPKTAAYGKMRVIEPLSERKARDKAQTAKKVAAKTPVTNAPAPAVTQTPSPDILNLATNNDRSVASLAREATQNQTKQDQADEVVISLH